MFNIPALLKFINSNNDKLIQKSEIKDFLETQNSNNPSIFDKYFNTISSDISIEDFKTNMQEIELQARESGNKNYDISFKNEEVAQKYEQINIEMEMQTDLFKIFGYKFKSDDEFDTTFSKLLSQYRDSGDDTWTKIENGLAEQCASTTPSDWMARLNTGKFYVTDNSFQDIVFEDIDLSEYAEAFKHICFNEKTFSKVSQEHLPKGFNPQEVFAKGKTIGLGIDYAHNELNNGNGYKGEGVSFAIIDSGTRDGKFNDGEQHDDIHFVDYQVSEYSKDIERLNHFHGRAVSYIAQEIAPDADLHYYATHIGANMDVSVLDNLKAILEKNKTLPENKKIRVLSMSMPLYGGEEAKKIVNELEQQGCWVITSGRNGDAKKFGYLEKIDPNGDVNDFNNYQIAWQNKSEQFDNLYINAGNRTVPDPSSPTAYRHDSAASQSWAIPVLAGYYVLACQADPTMDKDKFYQLANKTAKIVESTKPIYDGKDDNAKLVGRTTDKLQIKVIDINALLRAIEEEKVQ